MGFLAFVILVILIGLIPAAIAEGKGRSFVLWWIYGSALFIVALPHALMMSSNVKEIEKRQLTEDTKKCPYCAEIIKAEAIKCRFCGTDLSTKDVTLGAMPSGFLQTEQRKVDSQENASRVPGVAQASSTKADKVDLMAQYGITVDGAKYCYGEYRYDNLEHALNYARLNDALGHLRPNKRFGPSAAQSADDLTPANGAKNAKKTGLSTWSLVALGVLAVLLVVLFGQISEAGRRAEIRYSQAPFTYGDFAQQKKEECLRKNLQPPAGVTTEKFCEAYGNIQALCKHDGKTGGVCE